ncbi:MAG: hypothetical protein DMG21_08620 [Acidobacteria bacterium]|nr:MAG: hypothetical protein DMG21_08620 [Acidobacteriota bacterium]
MAERMIEDVRHEAERGTLLFCLILRKLEWMPFTELRKQMARQGYPMGDAQLQFHLNYLSQGGYVETDTLRSGRVLVEMKRVRATKRAVDLHDGRIPSDPGVAF